MNQSGAAAAAAATAPTGDCLGSDSSAPLSGIEYLDAWRVATRPFPGSVPPFAGFSPTDTNDPVTDGDAVGAAITAAVAAIESLGSIDPTDADSDVLAQLVEGVEQARRMIDAAATGVAGVIDARTPFRTSHGYLNARTFLTQRAQLSGPEAHRRLRTARMRTRLPEWASAARTGTIGIAQSDAMARVTANTRIDPDVLTRDAGMLLDDAINLPYTDFERNLRMWEALADPDGGHTRNERTNARRDINLHPRPDGGWNITGYLPELLGVEFAEIFAWFLDAEWRSDWSDARQRLGHNAGQSDLARTQTQRRADAMMAMARASVSRDPDLACPSASSVCVDILLDHETMQAHASGETPDPRRFRNVASRTQSGRRLHPDDAINTALVNHIRRVVYDSSGTVIELGRRSRLFRDSSRDAVMLLVTMCVWIGCDQPVAWCDADHSLGWKAHGNDVPKNSQPLCTGHQHLKETGFQVYRDGLGHWHIIDPHGNDVA